MALYSSSQMPLYQTGNGPFAPSQAAAPLPQPTRYEPSQAVDPLPQPLPPSSQAAAPFSQPAAPFSQPIARFSQPTTPSQSFSPPSQATFSPSSRATFSQPTAPPHQPTVQSHRYATTTLPQHPAQVPTPVAHPQPVAGIPVSSIAATASTASSSFLPPAQVEQLMTTYQSSNPYSSYWENQLRYALATAPGSTLRLVGNKDYNMLLADQRATLEELTILQPKLCTLFQGLWVGHLYDLPPMVNLTVREGSAALAQQYADDRRLRGILGFLKSIILNSVSSALHFSLHAISIRLSSSWRASSSASASGSVSCNGQATFCCNSLEVPTGLTTAAFWGWDSFHTSHWWNHRHGANLPPLLMAASLALDQRSLYTAARLSSKQLVLIAWLHVPTNYSRFPIQRFIIMALIHPGFCSCSFELIRGWIVVFYRMLQLASIIGSLQLLVSHNFLEHALCALVPLLPPSVPLLRHIQAELLARDIQAALLLVPEVLHCHSASSRVWPSSSAAQWFLHPSVLPCVAALCHWRLALPLCWSLASSSSTGSLSASSAFCSSASSSSVSRYSSSSASRASSSAHVSSSASSASSEQPLPVLAGWPRRQLPHPPLWRAQTAPHQFLVQVVPELCSLAIRQAAWSSAHPFARKF
ncbi:hypothetical protein C8R43DRAFT_945058 [Mycena crocata]|nr:hypothetical protein C8R43DRAFT_945058 [Mycena crocata]